MSVLEVVARGIEVPGCERFVCSCNTLREINVYWSGSNFDKLFLNEKIEENVPKSQLFISQLKGDSKDTSILAELGEKSETYLYHMFDLLKRQKNGEDGVLLTSGYPNIFYIRGIYYNVCSVRANWYSDGGYWSVDAYPVVEFFNVWRTGDQVVSRDC